MSHFPALLYHARGLDLNTQLDRQLWIVIKENLLAFEKFYKARQFLPECVVENHEKGNEWISMKESPAYTS
jgi:hypothetical protein